MSTPWLYPHVGDALPPGGLRRALHPYPADEAGDVLDVLDDVPDEDLSVFERAALELAHWMHRVVSARFDAELWPEVILRSVAEGRTCPSCLHALTGRGANTLWPCCLDALARSQAEPRS